MLKTIMILLSGFFLFGVQNIFAEVTTFDFKDPKKVNTITIIVDSALEPMAGFATGITGSVAIDLTRKEGVKGEIKVSADQIQMANNLMTTVLHSPEWLNVKNYPIVSFVFKKLITVKNKTDDHADVIISGDFTLKGITREIEIPVSLTYLKDKMAERNRKGKGDLLAIRTSFAIDRTQFDIKPDYDGSIVAKEIKIIASIIGYANKE